MAFPSIESWTRDSADIQRENIKRASSPCSFFWSQGKTLCLAADFFNDDRLADGVKVATAQKHRNRQHLALFGQLMATFEYMFKDYVAKTVDATDVFDERICACNWLDLKIERILAQRAVQSSVGALLLHPTLGWHNPSQVNERFNRLYGCKPIDGSELATLETLWVLRHSVAHNAGFVTGYDAARIGQPALAEKVARMDGEFIKEAFDFLAMIAMRLATDCGRSVMAQWMKSLSEYGPDYDRDQMTYRSICHLGACVTSRNQELPDPDRANYLNDWNALVV